MQRTTYTFDRVVRIIATLAVIATIFWLINTLRNVLLPFFLACVIAYFIEPLVELNYRLLRNRWHVIAVFMALIESALLIAAIVYFCLPPIIKEFEEMATLLKTYTERNISTPFLASDFHRFVAHYFNYNSVSSLISDGRLTTILDKGTAFVSTTFGAVFRTIEWLLTIVYVVFLLIDYQRITTWFKLLVPPKHRSIVYKIFNDVKGNMNIYFRSQAIIASCAAILYAIGFSIVGLPIPIAMGIIVGVLYMIPYFQYITLIPVALLCFIHSMTGGPVFWSGIGQCALVYVVNQCICDYILTPKIMGKAMGLNPAIILLSLSIWGSLLGLIGMIIALPLTTLLLAYYNQYIIQRNDESPGEQREITETLDSITKEKQL